MLILLMGVIVVVPQKLIFLASPFELMMKYTAEER